MNNLMYVWGLLGTITIVVATINAQADTRVPITDVSYQVAQRAAIHACMGDNGGTDLRKALGADRAIIFCGCASAAIVGNMYSVTSKYNLHYEDEWLPRMAEMSLSREQGNVCKSKAGI